MKHPLLTSLCIFLLAFGLSNCQSGSSEGALASDQQDSTAVTSEADPRLDFTMVPGTRVGLVDLKSATAADVLEAYGDFALEDSIHLGEGIFEPGIVLFKDSKNQVDLYWDAAMGSDRPSYVSIYGKDGQSDWSTPNGITIGTTLEEMEQLNGKPFDFYGFGWDYGGYVSDWKDGKLTGQGLSIRFEPGADGETAMELVGDVTLSSDNPALKSVKARVSEITLSDPSPNLMAMMQGGWRSTTDEGYEIIIEGDQISHYNNQRLTYSSTIEADPGCRSEACAVTGTAPEGFCFIEKGEFDAQCNLVLAANATTLEYTAIGATGGSLVFERVD